MSTDNNNQDESTLDKGAGEGQNAEVVTLSKEEYAKLNETVGSLKRDLKDLKKAKDETPIKETKTDNLDLVHKTFLRAAGIREEDEVEFALSKAKKWGMDIDKVVDDEDFQTQLGKLRDKKANTAATSDMKGSPGQSEAKNTTAYWKGKGTPPTADQVPDRKVRQKIVKELIAEGKGMGSNPYYNG